MNHDHGKSPSLAFSIESLASIHIFVTTRFGSHEKSDLILTHLGTLAINSVSAWLIDIDNQVVNHEQTIN